MKKEKLQCCYCGKPIYRYPSQIKRHNFCSKRCLASFSSKTLNPDGYGKLKNYDGQSKNMTNLNKQLNPNRMTLDVREKLRNARFGTGEGKSYAKRFSKLEHRVVAEEMLGRSLRKGEVVHHCDFNPRNNDPSNLMIFPSQREHAAYHAKLKREMLRTSENKKGGMPL